MSINSVGIRQEVGRINQVGLDCSLQLGLRSSTAWLGLGLFRHNYAAGDSPLLGTALKDVCSLRVLWPQALTHTAGRGGKRGCECVSFFLFLCVSFLVSRI